MDKYSVIEFRKLLHREIDSWSVSDNDSFVTTLLELRDSFDELFLEE